MSLYLPKITAILMSLVATASGLGGKTQVHERAPDGKGTGVTTETFQLDTLSPEMATAAADRMKSNPQSHHY